MALLHVPAAAAVRRPETAARLEPEAAGVLRQRQRTGVCEWGQTAREAGFILQGGDTGEGLWENMFLLLTSSCDWTTLNQLPASVTMSSVCLPGETKDLPSSPCRAEATNQGPLSL